MKTYKELREAGTQGDYEGRGGSIVTAEKCIANIEDDGGYEAPRSEQEANAQLIAHEHNNFPKLLAALERIANGDSRVRHRADCDCFNCIAAKALAAATNLKESHERP